MSYFYIDADNKRIAADSKKIKELVIQGIIKANTHIGKVNDVSTTRAAGQIPQLEEAFAKFKQKASSPPSAVPAAKSPQRIVKSNLTSTEIGKKFGISPETVNRHLADFGMIVQSRGGYMLTPHGESNGGVQKEYTQTGKPYVTWSESILQHSVLTEFFTEAPVNRQQNAKERDFRKKHPAEHRADDGHYVRSRGELLIDNWFYHAGIVHAYEKTLPIEEDVCSDFYLPAGKLYVEFWGLENDLKYIERKKTKIEIYKKYNFALLEIHNEQIENLDDILPKKLLQFGIKTY